jgi:hypothetical protein
MPPTSKSHPRKTTFQCDLATINDIPELSLIWYNTFTEDFARRLFPWTAAVQQWWDDANRHDLLHNPSTRYVVVRDLAVNDQKWKIIGYIKWVVPVKEDDFQSPPRFPPWAEDSDKSLCDLYFGATAKERWKHIGKNQDYC